jgi:hypothetical protein
MFAVILRSVCVGIASVVAAVFLVPFVALVVALIFLSMKKSAYGGGEVGWDLVSMAHNYPVTTTLFPVIIFLIGFLFGYRYFSRSLVKN